MKTIVYLILSLSLFLPFRLAGQYETSDSSITDRIKHEGLNNSSIEDLAFWMTDAAGPRLTASKGGERGNTIAIQKLKEYGLENVREEKVDGFEPGGWDNIKTYAAMISPYYVPFTVNPVAWTSGTKGRISSEVLAVNIKEYKDFDMYRGKLSGKIVLHVEQEMYSLYEKTRFKEAPYTDEELKKLSLPEEIPVQDNSHPEPAIKTPSRNEIDDFLTKEKAAVVLRLSKAGEYNVPRSSGVSYRYGDPRPLPQLNLPLEAFGRVDRLLRNNIPVKMVVEIKNAFTKNLSVSNIFGEIPGTDPLLRNEIVLIGAHIDSWHGGTGAVDNAAGCIIMMEAMRILKTLGLKTGRTIRIALWGGEEQGLTGSRAYARKYLADPLTKEHKPGYDSFMVYFNADHLTGRFRGIYLQGNEEVRPVFEEWLKPFEDMGCSTLSIRNFWNTDHISFDEVNLPAFTFIQDQGEFGRGYHSIMDTYERLDIDALKQNSIIMAYLVYRASIQKEKLPCKMNY